jgi:hypothetical protein
MPTDTTSDDGVENFDFEFLEDDVDPESALLENYEAGDGTYLIDFLEDRGYERPEDFELGREVNQTYDPDSPLLKYKEGGNKKVINDTERILAIFGLDHGEFKQFKEENYQ